MKKKEKQIVWVSLVSVLVVALVVGYSLGLLQDGKAWSSYEKTINYFPDNYRADSSSVCSPASGELCYLSHIDWTDRDATCVCWHQT